MTASSAQLPQRMRRATPATEIDKSDLCVTVDLVTGLLPYWISGLNAFDTTIRQP